MNDMAEHLDLFAMSDLTCLTTAIEVVACEIQQHGVFSIFLFILTQHGNRLDVFTFNSRTPDRPRNGMNLRHSIPYKQLCFRT